jgi:TIR domain
MKTISECDYTAFISYAHADDDLCLGWVTQFRNELDRGLSAKLRGVRLPPLHLSGDNGPVGGVLSDELIKRVDASFAMIIIVGDNYVQSTWCLKELAYFKRLFGDQGFRDRLYILALSQTAIFKITSSPDWQALMPTDEQVWMPFFDPIERDQCLKVYMSPNVVSNEFGTLFERLRNDFAGKVKETVDAAASPKVTPNLMPAPSDISKAKPSVGARAGVAVQMGFVAPASADAAAAALKGMAEQGLAVRQLSQDVVFSDFADLMQADCLVLPFDDNALLMTGMATGGHLQIQREAWLKKGKSADKVLWLDLRERVTLPRDWQGGAAYVATLNVAPLQLPALIATLRPKPVAGGAGEARPSSVRLYIESNGNERTQWEPMGVQIRHKWEIICNQMAPGHTPPLSLVPRALPVDQLDLHRNLDDADGVVLLWGRKTPDTLLAQIDHVEKKMAFGQEPAPGIVAYLMPPQPTADPLPAWGWQVLRFNAPDDQRVDVMADDGNELDRFLKKVLARRLQRDGVGASAASTNTAPAVATAA